LVSAGLWEPGLGVRVDHRGLEWIAAARHGNGSGAGERSRPRAWCLGPDGDGDRGLAGGGWARRAVLYLLNLPLALKSVTEPLGRSGLKKAVIRSLVQLVVYPAVLIWAIWRANKVIKAGETQ
jgi:hypothetical protein